MARADIKAGAAYVELYCKKDRFTKDLQSMRQNLNQIGADMISVGRQAAMAGAAILAPMGLAIGVFARFDDAMREVGAVTRATAAELKSMTDVAKELGRTTSFTAVEIGGLMAELGRGGFKPDQINEMTGAVLNLARATKTDATIAAGIMVSSIRQYGLTAADATRVSDGLTAAANNSFNTVEQLGEALGYSGKVAEDFNLSFEDTLALLGGLGNVGIQASQAGTTLRRLMIITGAEAKKLEGIFGGTFTDAAGNARPVVETLSEMTEATKDLGTAVRAQKFNEAFGLLGITGASAIGRNAGDIKQLAETIKAAAGIAQKTAEEMDRGIGGAFRRIASAVEGVWLSVGEALDSSLRVITTSFTELTGRITAFIEQNKELVVLAGSAAVALVGTGAALVAVGVSAKVAAAGIGMLLTVKKGAAVAAAIFAAATTAAEVATLSLAAAMSLAAGTTAANSAAWIIFGALQASYPAVASVVVGAITAISTAFAGQTLAAGLATLAMKIFSVAATAASGAAAAFWIVLSGPAAPFIIAAGAVVAVLGAIGVAAAIAAARAIDFSLVVQNVKQGLVNLITTAKQVGGVLMDALSLGDYAAAVEAGWLGIKIAFWDGASSALKAFAFLYVEAWKFTKRFFMQMLTLTASSMTRIANAIANPFRAAQEVAKGILDLMNTKVTFSFSAKADDARAELAALEKQMKSRVAARDANKAETDDAAAAEKTRQKLRDAGLTDQQIDAITTPATAVATEQEPTEDGTKHFDATNVALDEQIIKLKEGAKAAERFRLEKMGLTDPQIASLEPLMQEIKHLERIRDLSQLRTRNIADAGDRALASGMSPQEIQQRERVIVEQEVEAGRIDQPTADAFNEESAQRMMGRMEKLREEARRLREDLRTPAETLEAEMKKIDQLQKAGVLDSDAAKDARERAKKEAAKAAGRPDGRGAVGERASVATTSAHAAVAMGRGGGTDIAKEQLAETKRSSAALVSALREENRELRAVIKDLGLFHP